MSLALLILTAVLGLGLGVWLGMPGRYTQTPDEIDQIMDSGGSRRRRTKRMFTPLAWMQRKISTSGPSRDRRKERGQRRGFKLESPEERERNG